ncbi:MAG: hypothetical protein GY946_03540, partial [bacterium]|nr:hypothetical protein [bacterium]
ESINNLENGIQPELSANGLVKNNLSYGSLDSAMWLEGVPNGRAIGNVLHSSTTGLEVTISKDLVIEHNEMYNNTVGMGLYHPAAASEPALPVMGNWIIQDNYIHDNNLPNGAPGGLPSLLPPGGGVLLMGVSDNLLEGNTIVDNDFYGLAVVDFCLAMGELPFPGMCPSNTTGHDPLPRNNEIRENTFINNGTSPDALHPLAPYAADITEVYMDPLAGNCYADNTYATYEALLAAPAPQACP